MNYILKNLKSFIKNDTFIFIIAFISLFISSLILLLSYGLYNNYNNQKKEIEVFPESIVGQGTELLTKSSLTDYLFSINSEIINQTEMIYCTAHLDSYSDLGFRFSLSGNDIINSESFVKNFNSNLKVSGRYFSDIEMIKGYKVAVVYSEPHDKEYNSTQFITLDNEKYEVIGTTWFSNDPLVPFTSLKDNVKIDYIEIVPKSTVTRSMYDEYYNKANGIIDIEPPHIYDQSDITLNNNLILISVLISIISSVNFTSLFKYILLKRKKELAVLRLCGCRLIQAEFIYLIECYIIITSVYITASLFFELYIKTIITKSLSDLSELYPIKVYTLIYAIHTTVSVVILFSAIYRTIKVQIRDLVSGEEQ